MSRSSPAKRNVNIGFQLAVGAVLIVSIIALIKPDQHADAGPKTPISTVGIDTGTLGNTPRSLVGAGARQSCTRINEGQELTVDVFVNEVPADRGLSGFQIGLQFDPTLIEVTAVDDDLLISQAEHSDYSSFGDTSSDDGSLTAAAVDFGQPYGPEAGGSSEIGPGIFARITVLAKSVAGVSPLQLTRIIITDDIGQVINVQNVLDGEVAVNVDCGTSPPSVRADADCSGTVNTGDVLRILASLGGVTSQSQCPQIGSSIGTQIVGDVDCNRKVDANDALTLLQQVASSAPVSGNCPV